MSSLKASAQMDYDLQYGHQTALVYWVNERIHSRYAIAFLNCRYCTAIAETDYCVIAADT
ncbi:hypothetical protein ES288_D06G097100v1 [Gossypium darwinii]|uniref:Uncharacterized protein n=1 Tax=Gossypium darwinii TaxID=34276 RepID=A0A5D2C3Y3_GOSDA|nr:hypothetical protein ES288_D06G097100v1 [Gossypium darwinii]